MASLFSVDNERVTNKESFYAIVGDLCDKDCHQPSDIREIMFE